MSIKLRTATWNLSFYKTVATATGKVVDMFTLLDDREIDPETEDIVVISVPGGRQDVAEFIARSVMAGQRVIQGLPLGHPNIKDEQPGFEQEPDDGPSPTIPEDE